MGLENGNISRRDVLKRLAAAAALTALDADDFSVQAETADTELPKRTGLEDLIDDNPTTEEVRGLFEQLLGNFVFQETRKIEDSKGLYLWDVQIPSSDGGFTEYSYMRKSAYGEHAQGSATHSVINVTFYDSDGMPISGSSVAKLLDGMWKITI